MIRTLVAAFAIAILTGVVCSDTQAALPNVVVILADDMGFSDIGCYGGEIDTPNVDGLAAGGLRFTQAYNTARCWPTRSALLSGYYAQAIRRDGMAGVTGGVHGRRPASIRLLPELLSPAGYRSYHSGKWHIDGTPLEQGFERSLFVTGSPQYNFFDSRQVAEDGKPIATTADFYHTTAIGDHAVKCLREHAAAHADQPFFHYVAFSAPHFPLHAPQEIIAKYVARYRAGWNIVPQARYERIRAENIVNSPLPPMEREVGPLYPGPATKAMSRLGAGEIDRPLPWEELNDEQREFQIKKMAIHAAMIDCMDQQIGRILQQLREMKAFENTLILFASDNGADATIMIAGEGHDPAASPGSRKTFLCLGPGWSSCSNTPFRRHKMWVHEGGIATPWIVHWPAGITAKGELRRQLLHVIDLPPTVLELAGVPPPTEYEGQPVPPMQGRSFVSALNNPQATVHEELWWCHEGNRAIRVGDWKLVSAKNAPWELYDMASDRGEIKDLAATQPGTVAELASAWNRIADQCRAIANGRETAAADRQRSVAEITPGLMWKDQDGNDITAHGGCVIQVGKSFYWYGENNRLPGGACGIFTGVTCYTSTDFTNWRKVGIVLSPTESGPLSAKDRRVAYRPKVLYHKRDGRYVMILTEVGAGGGHLLFATSPTPEGPFTFRHWSFGANQSKTMDMGVYQEGETAYVVYSDNNCGISIDRLNDDYLSVRERVAHIRNNDCQCGESHPNPNYRRPDGWIVKGKREVLKGGEEGPALVKANASYFLVASWCSGWAANQCHYRVSKSLEGPWSPEPDGYLGDETSFDSQSGFILTITGTKGSVFINISDRWKGGNTEAGSTYPWLPLQIDGSAMTMQWYDKWYLDLDAGTWSATRP